MQMLCICCGHCAETIAGQSRLSAIIPRQQVNIPRPTVLKSIGLSLYHQKEVQPKMPVPHLEIRIVQRSKGSSAVAGAAYQAGEKLFSEYDQKSKDHRRKQPEVLYTEIMFPANAPPEYADRATLWNAVEEVEKQWNSQLARRFILALPREVPTEVYPQMMQEYCREHFVSKGMCCDFAIHDPDPPGHNPHCHIMLTMRAIDENGKWLPKSRKVYDLDENGERIKLPSGRWKSHKEDTVDWNEQYHAEEWRHGWELVQNKYLELAGSPERVDMRSYERQGLDVLPTVHMGAAVSALERKGIETNIGNLNRDIKAANRMMNAIRSTIRNLRNWIVDIMEATKEALAETEAQAKSTSPDLVLLLRDYLNLRKAERSDWSRYGQQKGTVDDLKAVSKAVNYLKEQGLFTLEDLDTALQGVNEKSKSINAAMKKASARMKVITGIQNAVADCQTHKAVHDKYLKIGWKARQAAFAESHKDELDRYNKAFRYLKKQGVDLNVNLQALQVEYDQLQATYTELAGQLAAAKEELQPMKDIRYWVSKVLTPEQSEVEKKPEPKHSITEKMKFLQEQSSNQQEQKTPQQKKQNMEL
jgi:predicted  nucleic acid-binding Zn-ribbon protein